MRARNAGGNSDWSAEATARKPEVPSAPTSLTAAATSSTRIELAWNNTATNEDGFRVERKTGAGSFAQVATVSKGITTWIDDGLAAGTTCTYRVQAYNQGGSSGWSNEASATTLIAPAAPTGLTATSIGPTEMNLTWTDNSDNEYGFKVERKQGSGAFAQVMQVPAGNASITDSNLQPGTEYTYRVCAFNQNGDSAFSNESSATTRQGLARPTELQATAVGSTRVDLTWSDNSAEEYGFSVERKAGDGQFVEFSRPPANTTSASASDLEPDTTYTFRVRAFDARGNSDWSNEVTITLVSLPGAPTNLTATVASATRVDLSWTDNASNETGFILERRAGLGDFVQVAAVGAGVTTFSDSGLTPGTAHTWRVRACNAGGNSDWSNLAEATTASVRVPAAPSNLTATLTGGHVLLRWSDNTSDETGFRLERQVGQGSFEQLVALGVNSTSYTDSNPLLDQTCTYRVLAFTAEAVSGYSNQARALASESQVVLGLGERGQGWLEAFDLAADGEPVHAAWPGVQWPAYGNTLTAPTYPASGDVDGDGRQELVIGLGAQGQGRVCVLDDAASNYALLGWVQVTWAAYANSGEAPTHPTCADLNGDGTDEIVVGLGALGQGWVQAFQHVEGGRFQPFPANGGWARVQWTGYATSGDAPTWPAGGDFNADGRDEVALGLGSGGQGWLQVLTWDGSALVPYTATAPFSNNGWVSLGWSAYEASGEAPVYPAAGDLDQDGKADLALGLGGNGAGWFRLYRSTGSGFESMPGTPSANGWFRVPWTAYVETPGASTHPACGDLDGDGGDDLLVGLGGAGQGWAYAVLGRTFTPAEGPDFYGWLQVRWGSYNAAEAPTWPAILNDRTSPLSLRSRPPAADPLGKKSLGLQRRAARPWQA